MREVISDFFKARIKNKKCVKLYLTFLKPNNTRKYARSYIWLYFWLFLVLFFWGGFLSFWLFLRKSDITSRGWKTIAPKLLLNSFQVLILLKWVYFSEFIQVKNLPYQKVEMPHEIHQFVLVWKLQPLINEIL